jgi:DDE_Tnp_1-associated
MAAKEWSSLVKAVEVVPDPRRQCKNLRHRLVDIVIIGFAGVLCGCDDFVEIEEFARLMRPCSGASLNSPTASRFRPSVR